MMSDKTTSAVQISQEYEQWLGTASRGRIFALRSVGISVANIARRFGVSREMIYRVMRSTPNEEAPAPDTSAGRADLSTGLNQQIPPDDTRSPDAAGSGEPTGGN